jgi:putative FmdB family regulatory protein
MPIYEYECAKCHQVTEAMQKFSDRPLSKCPHCGGRLSKLMSANSFQLKGGGWYVTDYARKSDKGSASGPPKGEAKPAAADSAAPAAAPAAKEAPAKAPAAKDSATKA